MGWLVFADRPAIAIGVEDALVIDGHDGGDFEGEFASGDIAKDERGPFAVFAFDDIAEESAIAGDWGEVEADDRAVEGFVVVEGDEILDSFGEPEAFAIGVPSDGPRHIGGDDLIFFGPSVHDGDVGRNVGGPLDADAGAAHHLEKIIDEGEGREDEERGEESEANEADIDFEAAPHDEDESEAIGDHHGDEEDMEIIGLEAMAIGEAEDGHPEDGEEPHGEDGPAEVGSDGAFEEVEESDEEGGSEEGLAEELIDRAHLLDGLRLDLASESEWGEFAEGDFEAAHEAGFGAAEDVKTGVPAEALGAPADEVIAEEPRGIDDDKDGEHDGDIAAEGAEEESAEDEGAEEDPDGDAVGEGEEGEADGGGGEPGDGGLEGFLFFDGADEAIEGETEEKEHEHLGEAGHGEFPEAFADEE